MSKTKNLNSYLKNVHDLIIGEKTLEALKSKLSGTSGVKEILDTHLNLHT